jgi:post-segregation antitoxin (ccd killing protein)
MVTFMLELDESIAQQAQAAGLLSSESVSALIRSELARKRAESWAKFEATLAPVTEEEREALGGMTDDEFLKMVVEEVREVRREMLAERRNTDSAQT